MSADFELARGRVLHFNEDAWDALQNALAAKHLTEMALHVAEQRKKDVVVLDLTTAPYAVSPDDEDAVTPRGFGQWLRTLGLHDPAIKRERQAFANWVADQIEAQSKPPRIPEPGLWGVVKARGPLGENESPNEDEWVRTDDIVWRSRVTGWGACWDQLIDPVLIRDGIEDQS